MSSGYGCRGNVSRCFPFWQQFSDCMVRLFLGGARAVCARNPSFEHPSTPAFSVVLAPCGVTAQAHAETPKDCREKREDYFECLHHKKYFTR